MYTRIYYLQTVPATYFLDFARLLSLTSTDKLFQACKSYFVNPNFHVWIVHLTIELLDLNKAEIRIVDRIFKSCFVMLLERMSAKHSSKSV